jgi:putative ABC transport system permease protein
MSVTWKLALSYAVRHPTRMLLTSLAMVASACTVVWVVSSYDALASQFGKQATNYLGRYDFFIVPEDPNDPTVDEKLVDALRKDPAVAEATPVAQVQILRLVNPNAGPEDIGGGPGIGGRQSMSGGPGRKAGPGGPTPKSPNLQTSKSPNPKQSQRPGPGGPRGFGPMSPPTLVGTDAQQPPYVAQAAAESEEETPVFEGKWIDPEHPERRGAVIDRTTAEQQKLKLGDEALVIHGTKEYRIEIVGIVKTGLPQMTMTRTMRAPGSTTPRTGVEAGPASSAIYVPLALAKHFSRGKAKINLINVQLKPETKQQTAAFRETWEKRVAESRPRASLLGIDDIKAGIEEGMMASRSRQEAWAATGLSLLAALFIIFTTLSMGVSERVRQFAIMRAVGLTRGQIARVIAIEGIILALIGWAGGLLAGWGLLAVVGQPLSQSPLGSTQGASLGLWCIVLTGIAAFGGALAASIFPAWRATSVEPLEAMSPQRAIHPNRVLTTVFTVVGILLILVNPILVFAAPKSMPTNTLYYVYMALGCSTMAVGFLLLTPAATLLVENVFGPLVARLLGLEPRLLQSQLGSNLWRTLGTTAALTVGLGLFVAMQIWGYSMLEPFKPGDWVPDALVNFTSGGLPDAEIAAVRAVEGVLPDRCIPLAVEQPKLAADITGSEKHNSVISQNNVIMIGLDPQVAFGGDNPLLKVRFVEGTATDAIAKLKHGRNCLVPDHFLRATKLKLGDKFSVVPPNSPSKHIEYTIAGAVSLPGWHWMTKFSGLRRREGRSAAMVFADFDTVREDFGLNQINFFWMNVDKKYGEMHLAKVTESEAKKTAEAREQAEEAKKAAAESKRPAPMMPMPTNLVVDAKRAAVIKIGEAMQPIAARNTGEKQPVNGQGQMPFGAATFGDTVRISTPDEVYSRITARASGMIWASCYLPLITLLITSLGVVNTVMASVRARRWEFGILRSQGVTRSGLFRMILAEGILIGLITCLLSLGFGILSGWCGTGISQHVSFFGGLAPPLIVPWPQLSIGFGMALGLCLLAALWPAILTGRSEPLKLLQAGRAAM